MLLNKDADDGAALRASDFIDHYFVLLLSGERHAWLREDPRYVNFDIEVCKIKRVWVKSSVDLSEKLSFHIVPFFLSFELNSGSLSDTLVCWFS